MTITKRQTIPKVKLPAANIYLDDIEEIINILKPDGEDQPPKLKFEVNDFFCESMDDLRQIEGQIGGSTLNFKINVWWQKTALYDSLEFWHFDRAELLLAGSAQRRIWVQTQIGNIFRRRTRWLGKAPWLVMSAVFLLVPLMLFPVDLLAHKIVGSLGSIVFIVVAGALTGYISFPLVYRRCIRSVAVLSNSTAQQGSWFQRHRDQIILHVVTSLISAIIGAVIALSVQRLLH